MIEGDEKNPIPKERLDINPSQATKDDLFGYGTAAKITGVEGRGTGEFALLVEGVARVRIDHITQDRPFFGAEVTYEYDDGERTFSLNLPMTVLMCLSYKRRRRCYARPLLASQATVSRTSDLPSIVLPTSSLWIRGSIPSSRTPPRVVHNKEITARRWGACGFHGQHCE